MKVIYTLTEVRMKAIYTLTIETSSSSTYQSFSSSSMAQSPISRCLLASSQTKQDEERNRRIYEHRRERASTLPVVEGIIFDKLYLYQGCYMPMSSLIGTMVAEQLFQAKPSDIILATLPKSGTTWLKSLLFATVHRGPSPHYDPRHYLTTLSAHECVPFIELNVYANNKNQVPDLELLPSPRLFGTHTPFHLLPSSIVASECKIVYLCRNPKDNFVSFWHYGNKLRAKNGKEPFPLDVAFERFCSGTGMSYAPFWDHVLGYWKASLERPEKILFMRYEELMRDLSAELKRLAEFAGCPFTAEEEEKGVVDDIMNLCVFENLSNLEVNKKGSTGIEGIDNNVLFRRGIVGDWVNHLTPDMAQRMDQVMESKFKGSGLEL